MTAAFYLAAISKKNLNICSVFKISPDEVQALYGPDIPALREEIKIHGGIFEPPSILMHRVRRITMGPLNVSATNSARLTDQIVSSPHEYYIVLSNRHPRNLPIESLKLGRKLAHRQG